MVMNTSHNDRVASEYATQGAFKNSPGDQKSVLPEHQLRALIIDDEASICESLAGVLGDEGWSVASALSGSEGLKKFKSQSFDLIFLDMWMEGLSGIETLQQMRDHDSSVAVIAMSGHGTIETAVRVTKLGAKEFLEKPLSVNKILSILSTIKEQTLGAREDFCSADAGGGAKSLVVGQGGGKHRLIGRSPVIQLVRKQIDMIAQRGVGFWSQALMAVVRRLWHGTYIFLHLAEVKRLSQSTVLRYLKSLWKVSSLVIRRGRLLALWKIVPVSLSSRIRARFFLTR